VNTLFNAFQRARPGALYVQRVPGNLDVAIEDGLAHAVTRVGIGLAAHKGVDALGGVRLLLFLRPTTKRGADGHMGFVGEIVCGISRGLHFKIGGFAERVRHRRMTSLLLSEDILFADQLKILFEQSKGGRRNLHHPFCDSGWVKNRFRVERAPTKFRSVKERRRTPE